MLKNNKGKLLVSSVIILLPLLAGLLLWDRLPDSFGQRGFTVFGLPLILLATHWGCLLGTSLDKRQRGQNQKALGIVFWIVPFISLFASGVTYSAALGKKFDSPAVTALMTGLLFMFIGNYLPKTKQNRTLGIRISWTLKNEENWNRTHRFGGKVWFVCGLLHVLAVFLPDSLIIPVIVCTVCAAIVLPVAYSYGIYRQHRKAGISYAAAPKNKTEKIIAATATALTLCLLFGVAVLMFTGDIEFVCGEDSLAIRADYWRDVTVDYTQIEQAEYRTDLSAGARTNGFGSARLLMGTFNNEELGTYTRYSYTAAQDCIVLTVGGESLVIGGKNNAETKDIYEMLSKKIPFRLSLHPKQHIIFKDSVYSARIF